MLKDTCGLTLVEYIVGAALILALVGASAASISNAVAQRLDSFRAQL